MKKEIREKIWKRNQDFRDLAKKVKEEQVLHLYKSSSFAEMMEDMEMRQRMNFDEPEDIDFELMDFYFDGMLSLILRHAGVCAHEYRSWDRAYAEFKAYISFFVGWNSFTSKERHPMLHTSEAFDLVREKLEEACYKGADRRRK